MILEELWRPWRIIVVLMGHLVILIPSSVYEPKFQVALPTTRADIVLEGVRMVELPNQGEKFEMKADHADIYQDQNFINMDVVQGFYINTEGKPFEVSGKKTKYNTQSRDIRIENDVFVMLEGGYQLFLKELDFKHQENKIYSTGEVKLRGPNIEKPDLELTGQGLEGDLTHKEYKILSNIQCIKKDAVKPSESYQIFSNSMRILPSNRQAIFEGDVQIEKQDFKMTSDRYVLSLKEKEMEIQQATAYDNVQLWQKDLYAKSQEAVFLNKSNKLILKGNPELHMNDTIHRGAVITFSLTQKMIRSQSVQGEVNRREKK